MEEDIVHDSCNYSSAASDINPFSKLDSWCSPVVDLRAPKEENFIPHKPEDVGRWIYKNQKPWMICPGSEVFDSSFSPSSNDRLMLERLQIHSKRKQRRHKLPKPKMIKEKLLHQIVEDEDVHMEKEQVKVDSGVYFSKLPAVGRKDDILALKRDGMHIHRCRLEKEVERLQGILKQEQENGIAFETALARKPGAWSQFSHLSLDAEQLLTDLAILEAAVSRLEEQIVLLLTKLKDECPQHRIFETFSDSFPPNMSSIYELLRTLSLST